MAGTLKTNIVQLGDSATATQNLTIRTNIDGTFTIARGNAGATTQDILTIDSNGRVAYGVVQSMVRVITANGYGSTNNKIRRFTTVITNQGTDITYADSATLGASFTINANGVYAITYCDQFSVAEHMGFTLNTSTPTTQITGGAASEILAINTAAAAGYAGCANWTGYLTAGGVIRPHTSGSSTGANTNIPSFTITKVA